MVIYSHKRSFGVRQADMYTIERISEILKLLEQNGRVEVNELSDLFNASKETIRRDLRDMEAKGLLKRTHGGAIFESQYPSGLPEFPVAIREIQYYKEKDAICKKAASFIKNGDSIFVDNSSTCLYLIKYIPVQFKVTLITNSIKLLMGMLESDYPNLTAVCLGGFFNPANLSTYGTTARKNAEEFYPSKSFMSCAGVHLPDQFTDSSLLEVDTKQLMIERSKEVFILADHTKFERTGPVFLSNFSAVNTLITDHQNTNNQFAPFQKAGINMISVEVN
ncbi:MAG: DeoR/GlpR transcriptional regulator [Chloroflexi bacterium HGW-Chloroflexi-4]|nr:MAG: DeoR/GlpR transcriptional regulator [Chloroflexi bacterium HGW-Chloroflexi-4]